METTFLENNESEFTHDECSSVLFKWLSNYNQRIFHKFPLALLSFPEDFPPGYLELLLKLHSLPLDLITYGSLALEAGIKNGARAAGSAMRRNPFPLIIPCHRVVSVSGLGGYTPGAFIKEELLVHEGLIKR
ncbi:MAG: MGMT family protein [Deltaproteobacteria bacterium]|nr:MGMT family protein [Deltaproteobacteria bacterium]